ncbi:Ubiquitin carboxyl-terminal hydrolase 42 [Bagarius yarrelli]|uniref:Ubiquitin carboxyl-terminal hydrolase 42 n=1 Tax=Bagarius yarrelli TaxID=175774 RepID=A0A556TIS7_BAGYA|nr:Ubiquitin carboxyl-terminal hydrolase 42 [Bagarius yarrelli]
MTIVDKASEKSDLESAHCKHSGSLTPVSSGGMSDGSSCWSNSSTSELSRTMATCVAPSLESAVYGGTTAISAETPNEQVAMNHGDGINLPQKILFPSERLSLKWTQVHRIGAGLQNLGNTCFLNAALQCLSYTAPLANYLLSREHSRTCRESGFCMLCIMQNHIIQVFANSGNAIKPLSVLHELKQDAHEFLRYTVDAMQKSCLPSNKLDRQTQATTLIHQIFGGYLRSRVKCMNCKAVSDTFDPYLDIALDIKNVPTITKALELFVKPEQLDWENAYKCGSCKEMVQASKRLSIHRNSNVLTLSLKRFSSFTGGKISKDVRYSEFLNLRPYMSQSHGEPQIYGLYAVLVHSGFSCYAGHYYCYVKASNGQWYQMNDSSVTPTDIQSVLNQQAYLLFYIKQGSTDLKNGDCHQIGFTPGHSSPRPVVTPKLNGHSYTSSTIIGPQLPPHMVKNNSYVNGNGASQACHSGSKPGSSDISGVSEDTFNVSYSSTSYSATHQPVRPTSIPQKRPKLSFTVGCGKAVRCNRIPSTLSSSSSSSASYSYPQSPSSTSKFHRSKQVNGTSLYRSGTYLVPYDEESSEESDQESKISDKSTVMPSGVVKASSENGDTKSQLSYSSVSHLPETNGSNCFSESQKGTKGLRHGPLNGHHKVNGFKHSEMASDSPTSESSVKDTNSIDSQSASSSKSEDLLSSSASTERAEPLADPLTQHASQSPPTPSTDIQTPAKPAGVIPSPQTASTESSLTTSQTEDELKSPNRSKMETKTINGVISKTDEEMCKSGNFSTWEEKKAAKHQEQDKDLHQSHVSTATKDKDKESHQTCKELKDRSRERYRHSHRSEKESYSQKERSHSRHKDREEARTWDRYSHQHREHHYKKNREDWESSQDWERNRRYQNSHRSSNNEYRELGGHRAREDSRDRWHYNGEQSNSRAKPSSPHSTNTLPQHRKRKHSLSSEESLLEECRAKKLKKSEKQDKQGQMHSPLSRSSSLLAPDTNDPNCYSESNKGTTESGRDLPNGHHKVNGFKYYDKASDSPTSESSIKDTNSIDSQSASGSKSEDLLSSSASTERAEPLADPLTQHASQSPPTPSTDIQTPAKPAGVIPSPQTASTESSLTTSQTEDELKSPNRSKMETKTINGVISKTDEETCKSGKSSIWKEKKEAKHQEQDKDLHQSHVSTATKDKDKESHQTCKEHYKPGHRSEKESYSQKERSHSRHKDREEARTWDRYSHPHREHHYKKNREDWESSQDWERNRRYQNSHRSSNNEYRELGGHRAREDSRDRWHYNGEQSNSRAKPSSPRSTNTLPQHKPEKRSLSNDRTLEECRAIKYKKSKKKKKDKHRGSEMDLSDRNWDKSSSKKKKKKKKKRRHKAEDRPHGERRSTLSRDKHDWKSEERKGHKHQHSPDQDSPHYTQMPRFEDYRQLNGHSGNDVNHYNGYLPGFCRKQLGAQIKYRDHTSSTNSERFFCRGEIGETGPVPCRYL